MTSLMEPDTHHLVVPRSARYLTVGALGEGLSEVFVLCHGYGQLALDILAAASCLESPERLLVAPEALSRFYLEDHRRVGASWMTREDRLVEMEDYIRYLDLLHDQIFVVVDRSRVALRVLGFSQGAATAARWAVRGQAKVDHLVLWGGALPPELDDEETLTPLRSMRVTLAGGRRDGFLDESEWEQQRARLASHRVDFDEHRFEGGHRLDDETLRRIVG